MTLPKGDSLSSLGGDSLWSLDSNNNPRRRSLVDLISFIRTTRPKNPLARTEELLTKDGNTTDSTLCSGQVPMSSNLPTERVSPSDWTSETTRNLLARIKQLREEPREIFPDPALIMIPPSTPTSPATSSPKTSTSLSSPSSEVFSPSSRKSSWNSRRLNPSMRRNSVTSLFSSPGSLGLGSRLPRLDLKRRSKKSANHEPSPPLSPLLSRSTKSRTRHVPLVGLGISGVDFPIDEEQDRQSVREDSDATLRPIKSTLSTNIQSITREDSEATLRPTKRRTSDFSNAPAKSPPALASDGYECSTTSSSRKTSQESTENRRPTAFRSRSADLLSSLPWNLERQKSHSPAKLSTRSVSGILSPSFTLKRFRSITPLTDDTTSSVAAGTSLDPISRAQKKSFNSSFDFPTKAESFSFTYTDLAAKLRRVRGNRESQTPNAVKQSLNIFSDATDLAMVEPAELQVKVNEPSYEAQLVDLRVKFGLPASKTFHTGPTHLSHPEHPYTWDHVNLRCLVCPQPTFAVNIDVPSSDDQTQQKLSNANSFHPAMRPNFATQVSSASTTIFETSTISDEDQDSASKNTTLENLTAVHPAFRARVQPLLLSSSISADNEATTITSPAFTTTSPTSSRVPLTCALCPRTCCTYSSFLSQLSSPTPETPLTSERLKLFRDLIRLTASGTPIGRSGARDSFSTFVRCSNEECEKTVCPGCASRCRLVGCGSVVCRVCREEKNEGGVEGWICGWHDN